MTDYDAFARRIITSGVLSDPWIAGQPRFRQEPYVVSASFQQELYRAAEEVAAVYNELCLIVADEPRFLDDFFGLTPYQKAMWQASQPHWHGIARADVFLTDDGLAFTEINCDTPTGEAEAVILGRLGVEDAEDASLVDPNTALEERFLAMIAAIAARDLDDDAPKAIGLVYPTEFTEDLSLVRLYKLWLETRGYDLVLGSPYNLASDGGRTVLFDAPVGVVLRHYKTDWWGERQSVWDDDEVPDTDALHESLTALFEGMAAGKATVVNPFGATLPQNKRAMAFFWEHIHRFSPHSQDVIQRYVPLTQRLETMHEEQLAVQREEWVLKSDYGAEGEEVIVGKHVTDEVWRESLLHARPKRWVAQRFFEAKPIDEQGSIVNHGVFLVAGEACGLYARVQVGPTDDHALSAPVLVR
ncbi:MAG: glutathionylspermidine synthase family protein [Labilithrix sp.]|nr:glutathionylspermidine synthase family protein [Labilithrix sp.]MCW5815038.1 glutathionylspermidine synthase family protein [Labilithrix sp.]